MTPELIAARYFNVDAAALHAVRIKDGLTNESYRITGGRENIVVRISNRDEASLQINRHSEAVVLDLAEQAGIGAQVLLNQPDDHVLITRELPGRNLARDEVSDSRNIARIAGLLCKLHALEVNETVRSLQLADTLQEYWRLLGNWGDHKTALHIAEESDAQTLRVLCHNDVHHLNLIDNGGQLWLLDWEYAGVGDPYFDLASVCCYHDFNAAQRLMLIDRYSTGNVAPNPARLDRMCWLFDYIKGLWFAVRNADEVR